MPSSFIMNNETFNINVRNSLNKPQYSFTFTDSTTCFFRFEFKKQYIEKALVLIYKIDF